MRLAGYQAEGGALFTGMHVVVKFAGMVVAVAAVSVALVVTRLAPVVDLALHLFAGR